MTGSLENDSVLKFLDQIVSFGDLTMGAGLAVMIVGFFAHAGSDCVSSSAAPVVELCVMSLSSAWARSMSGTAPTDW